MSCPTDLLKAFHEGRIDDSGLHQLQEWLLENPDNTKEFVRGSDVHVELSTAARFGTLNLATTTLGLSLLAKAIMGLCLVTALGVGFAIWLANNSANGDLRRGLQLHLDAELRDLSPAGRPLLIDKVTPVAGGLRFSPGGSITVAEGAALDLPDQLTISCWLWLEAYPAGTTAVISRDSNSAMEGQFALEITKKGLLQWKAQRQGDSLFRSAEPPLQLGRWSHVAVRFDNGHHQLFIDGHLRFEENFPFVLQDNDEALLIGKFYRNGTGLNGVLADLRVYNRALVLEEVAYLASDTPEGVPESP